jgi:anti-sigma factor RsiW
MTCDDVGRKLDAFVDGELPGPALLEVARHASGCRACERAVRDLAELQQAVGRTVEAGAAALDLSAVWPAVAARVAHEDARRAWRRRLRAAPAWAAAAALAAGAIVWLRMPAAESVRVASRPRPNQAVIERLDSASARLELRRERKNGTMLIMVSADGDEVPR